MKFIDNIDYNNIDKGIDQLKNHKFNNYLKNKDELTIFHVYWYGNINRHQLLCINSYLATQNLKNTELWVWLDKDTFDENCNKIPKHKNIKIKKYDLNDNYVKKLFPINKFIKTKDFLKFRSDIARLCFLYEFGGVYYDLDFILLKDLSPLLDIEFCYQWSNLKKCNNALLRFKKNSKVIENLKDKYLNLFDMIENKKIKLNNMITPSIEIFNNLDVTIFPCVMFDPVWILFDNKQTSKYSKLNNFDDFFKRADENINDFFENQLYGYHWHSRSSVEIEKDSYFDKIEQKINNQIKNLK